MTVRPRVIALITALVVGAVAPLPGHAQRAPVILATTTSTQDSGLLDVLVPTFEKQTGYSVKTIAVGTGQSLALAGRGEADVALCHAPSLEKKYVADGKLFNRRLVMYNDFVIVGPAADPAQGKGTTAAAAMKGIAANGPRVNATGGKAFADFMIAPETQRVIKTFGVEKFGQPLFVPGAGTNEAEVGEKK